MEAAPQKIVKHFANGKTRITYRYGNGMENARKEGSADDFWAQVQKLGHGCWSWRGHVNNNHNTTEGKSYDYGTWLLANGTLTGAHRAAVYYLTGKVIPEELDLVSLCGDELCVNPEHRGVVDRCERVDRKTKAVQAVRFFSIVIA